MYKIGEFSWLSQVPIRTLRYYDQIGLLIPAHVERPSGYRCYAAEQLEQLNRILVYKDLGLSLREIRILLADRASAAQTRDLVQRKRADLERRVEAERRRLERAAARLGQRGAIWHACEPGTIDCEAFEIIPERIPSKGRLSVHRLPPQQVATLVYRGDSDYLPAYRAIRAWIAMAGLDVTGPKREFFLRGDDSLTEIQFPIGRAPAHRIPRTTGHTSTSRLRSTR